MAVRKAAEIKIRRVGLTCSSVSESDVVRHNIIIIMDKLVTCGMKTDKVKICIGNSGYTIVYRIITLLTNNP